MGERATGTAGGWRLLRGVVVGSSATTLAVGGHCLASGEPPTWTALVPLTVLLGTVSTWLSAYRWTFPRLLVLLLAAQAGMHAAFVGTRPPLQQGHLHGHAGHAADAAEPTATVLSTLSTTPAMFAAHVAAAVATAVLLRRGEGWLCGVLDALALRVFRLLDAATNVYGVPRQPVPVVAHDRPRRHAAADAWWQRGPPR